MITGMLIGAAIALAGFLLGRFLPERRKSPKPIEAVCGCKHHHSMHDPQSGACNDTVKADRYNQVGDWTGYEHKPCPCRRYSGPEPLPSYYAPEIGSSGA